MFTELFTVIAPVFICAGIGFAWAKMDRPYDTKLVTALIANFGTPCLVFSSLIDTRLAPQEFGNMVIIAITAMVGFALVSAAVLKVAGCSKRTFLAAMTVPNTGNMGLPLCLFAFGEKGLALAIAYYTIASLTQFTFGPLAASGGAAFTKLLKIPLIYAVLLAVAAILTGFEPPRWINNTTRILGGMTIPMLLITLGFSLASLRVSGVKRCILLSVFRLVMGFAGGVLLADAFGLEGIARGVVIVESSMPVAVFAYLFAQQYDRSPEEVAGVVVISTVISFATLPALMWYVL
ncbi:MAG: AEC family transporter [Rhodospirillales bacterium]|nr:AEC family transporter [Rhodospirillales bacterium]